MSRTTTIKRLFNMIGLKHITLNGFMNLTNLENIINNNFGTLQSLTINTHKSLDICKGNICENILKLVTNESFSGCFINLSYDCFIRISVQNNFMESFKEYNMRIAELA